MEPPLAQPAITWHADFFQFSMSFILWLYVKVTQRQRNFGLLSLFNLSQRLILPSWVVCQYVTGHKIFWWMPPHTALKYKSLFLCQGSIFLEILNSNPSFYHCRYDLPSSIHGMKVWSIDRLHKLSNAVLIPALNYVKWFMY